VVVRTVSLAEENRLRYERWVEANRREVEEWSNGRLGHIHIPGMNDPAYRTTFEEVLGRHFFEYTTDTRSSRFEPSFRWTRPSVTLADENNYSDGHCFAWAYKEMGIGPLIGMPVAGTCTFGGGGCREGRGFLPPAAPHDSNPSYRKDHGSRVSAVRGESA